MQSDFLPNFILCNTTQRFIRSSKAVSVQKPSIPSAKPSFYCGTQVSIPVTAIDETISIKSIATVFMAYLIILCYHKHIEYNYFHF